MKLTNQNMIQYLESLNKISNKVYGKLGYAVARNMRKIHNELTDFNDMRLKYIQKYGSINEKGEYVLSINTNEYQNFVAELSPLLLIEHNVDIYKIDIDSIIISELTAQEIMELDFMIEEDK